MQLNPAAFNAFLSGPGGIGQEFLLRPSSACPCINDYSGAADPQCPKCAGKGVFWRSPIQCRAGMTNQQVDKKWIQAGLYEAGDATLTVPADSPMYDAGQFDRLTLLNGSDKFSKVLTRGAPTERLFFQVVELARVFWLDGQDNEVAGGLPKVSDDGLLTWATGAPPVGQKYTIEGTKRNEYFVWNSMPSDRNAHYGKRLPKKILARSFDLFGR